MHAPEIQQSTRVRIAKTMVADQLECTMNEALAAIDDTARATDETLDFLAGLIVAGRVRFDVAVAAV